MKDAEFEKYQDILKELRLPFARDSQGRTGVVEDRETAEQILAKLQATVRRLPWQIEEV